VTSTEIYSALYKLYANYEYKLNNTFVFRWESDFFAMSKTGYFMECEVKVSRSDFFVDFKKQKHRLFQDVHNKKTHHILVDGSGGYDSEGMNVIGNVELGQLRTQYGDTTGRRYLGWRWGMKNGKSGYWVNDYGRVHIDKRIETMYAPLTRIRIKPIESFHVPHRFNYVVPHGLIKVEEVPKYAGLIYVNKDNWATQVKAAPFLHKRKMDLDKILLKKYYNLWVYKVPLATKEQIRGNYSETNEQVND
jgi:hypothetical protein